jgi:hypothetical protein
MLSGDIADLREQFAAHNATICPAAAGRDGPSRRDIGERVGHDVIGGPPRRPVGDRGHQGSEAPRPHGGQRLSRPHGARLLQRGRELGAYRPAFSHHRAENVKEQSVNVVRGDHALIAASATRRPIAW